VLKRISLRNKLFEYSTRERKQHETEAITFPRRVAPESAVLTHPINWKIISELQPSSFERAIDSIGYNFDLMHPAEVLSESLYTNTEEVQLRTDLAHIADQWNIHGPRI